MVGAIVSFANRFDALSSRLHERIQIGIWMVGAIVLSPTGGLGVAWRVVVARARGPHDAVIQHCPEYLGFWHPDFELEGSSRSVVIAPVDTSHDLFIFSSSEQCGGRYAAKNIYFVLFSLFSRPRAGLATVYI